MLCLKTKGEPDPLFSTLAVITHASIQAVEYVIMNAHDKSAANP